MPFQKGNPGKPKGAKSAKTKLVEETAAKLNCDPFKILCLFANGDWKKLGYENECYFSEKPEGDGTRITMGYVIEPEMRLHAAKEACKYLYSQKRAIEVSGELDLKNEPNEELEALKDWYRKIREL